MSKQNPQPRAPRFNIRLSAELKIENKIVAGTTRNLSSSGVCVELDRVVPEGKQLGLKLFIVEDEIEAEGARSLDVTGTVQWTAEAERGYAVGIKFINLTPQQSQQLQNALRALGES
jgi:hypothetical protein